MSGMDTPATTRNETISRSGPDSVAISAGSRAQRPASSARSRCSPEAVVAAGSGGKTGGGATDAPHPRVVPPPGPAAALLPRGPVSGWAAGRGIRSGRDPPEFVRPNPRVPTTPGGTFGASLVSGRHSRKARPSEVARIRGGARNTA
jgi:hypothetical protein